MKTKTLKYLISLFLVLSFSTLKAQSINWQNIHSEKNMAKLYLGAEYSINYGIQYSRIFKTNKIIWLPFIDFSLPSGNKILDDYKLKLGTSVNLFQKNNWILSADISIINRRNHNPFVIMQSFGSESGLHFGYYTNKFFLNLHMSTDNSLITYLKHSDIYKTNYSNVKDAWYQNTAQNIMFGFNSGYSFQNYDITLSSGIIRSESFKNSPSLPIYLRLGFNYRF